MFSGGYVGVDVVFVISGYLITSIILSDQEAGRFTLIGFYERRARRILPALLFVIVCCLPFAWLWMAPAALASFAASIVATATFSNNIALMFATGYFSPWVEGKPLLHTWSLGVEEQFYVVFPLFVLLCLRRGKRQFVAITTAVALASLALSELGARYFIEINFYSSLARAWELLLGSLVALYLRDREPADSRTSELLSFAGVFLIAYSIIAFDEATPFPSVYALAPTLGAASIILFAKPKSLATRLLSCKVFVGIGLISYSAYLWHQPLFAFARVRLIDEPDATVMATLCLATFALAYVSWQFVERPFRRRSMLTRNQLFAAALAVTIVLTTASAVGYVNGGFVGRFTGEAADAAALMEKRTSRDDASECVPVGSVSPEFFPASERCAFGAVQSGSVVVVLGDSHAGVLPQSLDSRLEAAGFLGILESNADCHPIPNLYTGEHSFPDYVETCSAYHRSVIARVTELRPAAIVVAVRWAFQLYPVENFIEEHTYNNGEGGVEHDDYFESFALENGSFVQTPEAKTRTVVAYIRELVGTQVPIVLVYPIPETGWNIPNRNFKEIMFGNGRPDTLSTSYNRYLERNRFTISTLDAIGNYPNLFRVRPSERLCNTYVEGRCVAQIDGQPLYFDEDHLTFAGTELFVQDIMAHID